MGPRFGSINHRLSQMDVGDRIFVETTLDKLANVQRQVQTTTRRPDGMSGWEFTTSSVTGVSAKLGVIHYLVAIERTK